MSKTTCNVSETVQDRTKLDGLIGSCIRALDWLVPKSMTLDDLERPKRTVAEKNRFTKLTRKISMMLDP